jgi:2-polyprenyl-6-methoxyphenol hydroxylase-like FAD-dependent oxidoreductase
MATSTRSDDKEISKEVKLDSQTVVIVGGGPIGLAHAWGLKKLNPKLKVIVLEKYKEYQRSHTLIMQHEPLEGLMRATKSLNDPALSKLLTRLIRDSHIRTNELEDEFKKLALENGVEIKIEEVQESTIQTQLAELKPSLIIGADGTHSVVNRCLFPADNQVKVSFDYVLQLRFEIDGDCKAKSTNTIEFYQAMARYGMIANEYTGRYDEEKKKTPVTMQMMIPREAYLKLKAATSKSPIMPFVSDNKIEIEEKKLDPDLVGGETISYETMPTAIRAFIDKYLKRKRISSFEDKQHLDPRSIRISVNEAPATYAKQPTYNHHGIPTVLVGDAGLGLSYFKGLNAGIESTAKWFTLLAPSIESDFSENIMDGLNNYSHWFTEDFSKRKVKEVESYSSYRIRAPEKLMQNVRNIKGFSEEDTYSDDPILEQYFLAFNNQSSIEQYGYRTLKTLYPHRSHDPTIKLGQFEYIPIIYTMGRIFKLFYSYCKPYKSDFQFKQDVKQPLVGLVNLLTGGIKFIASILTLNTALFFDGSFTVIRGTLEIITFPFAWTIKPLIRGSITLIAGEPKIEENSGIKKLAKLGLKLLAELKDDKALEEDFNQKYQLLAISSDLHRKFDKSSKRQQSSSIEIDEKERFASIRSSSKSISKIQFKEYFLLFSPKHLQKTRDDPSPIQAAKLIS